MHRPLESARAFYHIYGDGDQAIALEQFFKQRGYVVQEFPPFLSPDSLFYAMGYYLAPLIGLVLIFTVVAVVAMALLSAREFGVLRLHGHGRAGIFLKVLSGAVPTIGVGWILGTIAALAGLRLYNGGVEMWLFARTGFLFTAVLWALCLASLGLGIALAAGRGIPEALNGRVDTVPAVAAVAVTHLVVVLIVATAGVSVLVLTSVKDRAEERVEVVSQHSSPVGFVGLSGSVAGDGRQITTIVAKSVRQAAAAGEVILGDPGPPQVELTEFPGGAARVLVINEAYLRTHPELPAPARLPSSDEALVLVPAERASDADGIAATIAATYRSDAQRTETVAPRITHAITAVQKWPLIPDQEGLAPEQWVIDPVVVVVGPDLSPIGDVDLVSALTQNRLVFSSAAIGRDWVQQQNLQTYVLSVQDEQEAAQHAARKAAVDLRRQFVALLLGAVVLVLTAVCLALLLGQARAQRLFVEWIHGWSWTARHGVVLAAAALMVTAVTVAWVVLVAPDLGAGPLPPGEADRGAVRGGVAALAAGASVLTFLISLAAVSSRTDHRQGGRA